MQLLTNLTSRRGVIALAAASLTCAVALSACSSSSGTKAAPSSSSAAGSSASSASGSAQADGGAASAAGSSSGTSSPAAPSTTVAPAAKTVRVTSDLTDGQVVGVGMPIVLNFSPAPTDATAFTKAAVVTVDGTPVKGAWYWEKPYADQPVQAHYRLQNYWPANSTIEVKLPIGGLSAGTGLVYAGGLTSVTFKTGDAHISTVSGAAEKMVVRSNGKIVKTLPVSLGKSKTPTYTGTKIVMQKGENTSSGALKPDGTVQMKGPGYDEAVKWSVRITADGEYVHAAPWNSRIGQTSTSNGCTNLSTANAKWYYNFALLGDVVTYTGTGGKAMTPNNGLGDWNVAWSTWLQGGMSLTA